MNRPFRRGMMMGLLGPVAFVVAALYWVYRATGKIPFPARRLAKDELVLRLVEPADVPAYWRPWRDELEPVVERAKAIIAQFMSEFRRD